jgi:hypothetical protein
MTTVRSPQTPRDLQHTGLHSLLNPIIPSPLRRLGTSHVKMITARLNLVASSRGLDALTASPRHITNAKVHKLEERGES